MSALREYNKKNMASSGVFAAMWCVARHEGTDVLEGAFRKGADSGFNNYAVSHPDINYQMNPISALPARDFPQYTNGASLLHIIVHLAYGKNMGATAYARRKFATGVPYDVYVNKAIELGCDVGLKDKCLRGGKDGRLAGDYDTENRFPHLPKCSGAVPLAPDLRPTPSPMPSPRNPNGVPSLWATITKKIRRPASSIMLQ